MIDLLRMQERTAQNLRRQAILHEPIEDIARRIQVPLEAGEDNLDLFEGAVCQLDKGAVFGIIHHHSQPSNRTTLLMDNMATADTVFRVIAALGVQDAALTVRQFRRSCPGDPGTHL